MPRTTRSRARNRKDLLQTIRELRMLLGEINQKLDHLIDRCRRYYLTEDLSHSTRSEFRR